MKTGWFVGLAAAFYIFMVALYWPQTKSFIRPAQPQTTDGYSQVAVEFSDVGVRAQVPLTAERREQGLAGRTQLSDTEGMLWRFDQPQRPMFWMKGMLLSLDFIWIDHGQVVEITSHVPPPTDPSLTNLTIYEPEIVVTAMLEVADGFADRQHLRVGDPVTIVPADG